jgi:hypothetical protein
VLRGFAARPEEEGLHLKSESLTYPYSIQVFLEEILGRSALHVVGDPGKFSMIASWATLNDLLSFGGLSYPRLRLFKGGAEVPERLYTGGGGSSSPSLLVRELTGALRGGATLAIESVDELRGPISDLCQIVEEAVAVPTHADMFASWGEPTLTAMRCNEHDVFMFQVEGRREWRLHCPPDHAFMLHDPGDFEREPSWRGVLGKGDALYVPRGWLHRDEPAGDASLCIAAKFRQPTGTDLIGRLTYQLAGTRLSSDIPRFGPAQTRIRFSLPWSAGEAPPPVTEDLHIVPLVRFPGACIRRCPGEDAFEVFVGLSPTKFDHKVFPIVERVLLSRDVTAQQLLEAFQTELPRDQILQCIAELIAAGAAWLRGQAPKCPPAPAS